LRDDKSLQINDKQPHNEEKFELVKIKGFPADADYVC